jgi:choline dehydrogenase
MIAERAAQMLREDRRAGSATSVRSEAMASVPAG